MSLSAPIYPEAILLRGREVAAMVGVTERTVERWAQAGLIERIRIGGATRYRRSDVEALAGPRNESRPADQPGATATEATADGVDAS